MKTNSHSTEVISGLLLFLLFATAMLFVLLFGAKAYQNISASMEEQYKERTCISYIAAKVRHADSAGAVSLVDFGGTSALSLDETVDGQVYSTLIYYYQGNLYELYAEKNSDLQPEDGFSIIAMDNVVFETVAPSLFRIECSLEGRTSEIFISTMSEKEASLT